MIKGLYRRLALVLLSVFLVLGAVLFWVYERAGQQLQQETIQELHLNLANFLVQDIQLQGDLNEQQTKKAFNKIMMLDPATELYIISPEGKVLTYDAPDKKIIRRLVDIEPIRLFLSNSQALPIVGDDPRSYKQKVFSVAPIYDLNQQLQSYLYIIIQGEKYDKAATLISLNKSWLLGLSMVAAALAFLLLTALLLFYKFTRPLVKLNREVSIFEQSGFQQLTGSLKADLARDDSCALATATPDRGDELQQLRRSFQHMSHKIVEQIHSLQKHDQLRREFLTHVSHDLRTPLAGMRAYLETLQQRDSQLTETERSDFLHKALLTNKQLAGMIDELFELARLEHGQVKIQPDDIMISDLLSDMYASLSGMASQKGIHLKVELEDDTLTVFADVARLERVLQNLISNAIVYTPVGGTVAIKVKQNDLDAQCVLLSVWDTGQGIAENELPHVFEPYFRSTNGQKAYHEGKGLGLAIASGLLALHGIELKVRSQLGQGTVFWFNLPITQRS